MEKKGRLSRKIHSLEPSQDKLNRHIFALKQKFDYIEQNEVDFEEYLTQDADTIITAFGSMARFCKDVVNYYRENGIKMGLFRPKTLYPFPYQRLRELSLKANNIIDVEMNLGQMLKDVSLAVMTNSKVSFIGKPVGSWLTTKEIIDMTDKILNIKKDVEAQNASV